MGSHLNPVYSLKTCRILRKPQARSLFFAQHLAIVEIDLNPDLVSIDAEGFTSEIDLDG